MSLPHGGTYLEYVCRRLLGPPAKAGGRAGESYWCCPFHDDGTPSFHTLPSRPGYPDKWKCFGCGKWGDALDLLRWAFPDESEAQSLARLAGLRAEYEQGEGAGNGNGNGTAARATPRMEKGREGGPGDGNGDGNVDGTANGTAPAGSFPFRGVGCPPASRRGDERAAHEALAALLDGLQDLDPDAKQSALQHSQQALTLCHVHDARPSALARLCDEELWYLDQDHREQCHDPECTRDMCRAGPPWWALPEAEYNARALAAVRQEVENMHHVRPDVPVTPAAAKRFLCELLVPLGLAAGVRTEDLDFLRNADCDGGAGQGRGDAAAAAGGGGGGGDAPGPRCPGNGTGTAVVACGGGCTVERADASPEAGARAALYAGIARLDPAGQGVTVAEIVEAAESPGTDPVLQALREALLELCPPRDRSGTLTAQSAGPKLRQLRGRVVGGRRLERLATKSHRSTPRWRVVGAVRGDGGAS
jgi:hypothetical protein